VVSSDQPISESLRAKARNAQLQTAETVTFPSMALNAANLDRNALAAVKAVSPAYPLRGSMRVSNEAAAADAPTREIPRAGTVWVDPQLLQAIGAKPGDELKLGESTFRIDRVITIEPDRGTASSTSRRG